MISIHDLHFHYPNREFLLAVPEFAVTSGEKVAVVGPSGSGKTTLLNLLAGILTPKQGTVQVGGGYKGFCVSGPILPKQVRDQSGAKSS